MIQNRLTIGRRSRPVASGGDRRLDAIDAGIRVSLHLVFPNPYDAPSTSTKQAEVPSVPSTVLLDLLAPERLEGRAPKREAPPVPEIAVDEDRDLHSWENEIRPTGQILRVLAIPEPPTVRDPANGQLRGRIFAPYPRHRVASLLGGQVIGHWSKRGQPQTASSGDTIPKGPKNNNRYTLVVLWLIE